jgi:prepilin-type N-terminal cleavage/methylation domain-containing protein
MIAGSKTHQVPFEHDSGLTLVELLVALTIFTFVISTSMYMFGFVLNLTVHSKAEYADDTQSLSRLRDSIASMFYFIGDRSGSAGKPQNFHEFFYGSADEMEYVSSQSTRRSVLTLTRLYLQDGALWIAESPLYDVRFDYLSPRSAERVEDATLLLDGIDSLRFRYLTEDNWREQLTDKIPRLVEMTLKTPEEIRTHYIGIGSDFTNKAGKTQNRVDILKSY